MQQAWGMLLTSTCGKHCRALVALMLALRQKLGCNNQMRMQRMQTASKWVRPIQLTKAHLSSAECRHSGSRSGS